MAITKIPAAGFTGNNFRNIIINGDHSIFQRGDTATGVTDSIYSAPDRWKTSVFSTAVFTISKSTDVPSGQGFASSLNGIAQQQTHHQVQQLI